MKTVKASESYAQKLFINQHIKRKRWITFFRVFLFVLIIGLWELATYFKWIDPFIFSAPSRVFDTFNEMMGTNTLLPHVLITIGETFISFLLGCALGIGIAILLWWFEKVAKTLEPYLVVLNSLPKTALAPIIIVWLGNTVKAIIFTALSFSIVVTIITIYNSFTLVDDEKIKLIKTFGGSKKDVLTKVVIPSNIANIISALKVNIGLSLIGVIIGEFLAAKAGLGYLIIYGSQVFKLDWVMMSLVILAILATLFYELILVLERKANH
jgi:NitT/TauT family transport system permease protein